MNKYNIEPDNDFNLWDIRSVFKYILSKPIEFLLLISVFIIIYSVDYISRINSAIYGVSQSMPFMGPQTPPQMQPPFSLKLLQQKKRRKQQK